MSKESADLRASVSRSAQYSIGRREVGRAENATGKSDSA